MSTSRVRTREREFEDTTWYEYFNLRTSYSLITNTTGAFVDFPQWLETTADEVHKNYPHEGGPFESRKYECEFQPTWAFHGYDFNRTLSSGVIHYAGGYRGNAYARPVVQPPRGIPPSEFSRCQGQGASAWDKFKPTKPVVELGVFLAELRDLPGLVFKRLNKFRNLGNNYLAYQFGWKPFLGDLISWFESIQKLDAQIAQLKKDNGRWIKRGGALFSSEDEDTTTTSGTKSDLMFPGYYSIGNKTVKSVIKEKCWFSARFRYYIPGLLNSKFGKLAALRRIWGLELTPEQVWQLIPFSWLADWFTNIGPVISNLCSSMDENLVAKYAYVMLETSEEYTTSLQFTTQVQNAYPTAYEYHNHEISSRVRISTKNRATASPFGFNLEIGDLNNYQRSILAALGISRLKF